MRSLGIITAALFLGVSCALIDPAEERMLGPIGGEQARLLAPMPPTGPRTAEPEQPVPEIRADVVQLPPVIEQHYPQVPVHVGTLEPAGDPALIVAPMNGRLTMAPLPSTADQALPPRVVVTPPVMGGSDQVTSTVISHPTPTLEAPPIGTAPPIDARDAMRMTPERGVTPTIPAGGLPITSTVTVTTPGGTVTGDPVPPGTGQSGVIASHATEIGAGLATQPVDIAGLAPRMNGNARQAGRVVIENDPARPGGVRSRIR